MIEVTCTKFECDNDLSKYTDSMLFDSGENIVHAEFMSGEKTLTLDLEICGDVSVTYKGEVYHRPSDFPEELKELIRANPNRWDIVAPSGEDNDEEDSNIYVNLNNWFEVIYEFDDYTDGDVFEEDLSKFTPETLKNLLTEWAQGYYEWKEEE